MKIILFNGSPHKEGCTYTALSVMKNELEKNGIEAQIFQAGGATSGCKGCGYCAREGKCVTDDCLNDAIALLNEADGVVFGSPVHYAAASGAMTSFLDRLFCAAGKKLRQKPCAVAVSCRRGGATATLDQLLKYPEFNQMPIITGQYWAMVHGNTPDEVMRDEEGIQVMRTAAKNMAWILKCIELGKRNGITPPETEQKIKTNFIG